MGSYSTPPPALSFPPRCLCGKGSASRAADLAENPIGLFTGPSQTSDLKTCTPVNVLPGAWVSTGTGWPSVSIL